jgi:hypothetical protein
LEITNGTESYSFSNVYICNNKRPPIEIDHLTVLKDENPRSRCLTVVFFSGLEGRI